MRTVMLDQWGPAWSSGDPGKIAALFTDDAQFEDVPFGAVTKGTTSCASS